MMMIGTIGWLFLGIIGVLLFVVSEIRLGAPREITLGTVVKATMLILMGPLAVALYIHVWGDDIVLWKQKPEDK